MKIEVTEEDIVQGRRCDCKFCPIARVVTRALGREAWVTKGAVYDYSDRSARPVAILPNAACNFVVSFDNFLTVKPFSFELTLL